MANVQDSMSSMQLHEFNRTTPPGWKPGNDAYPFRLFLTRITLWWRITTLTEEEAGPMVASRLQGMPFTIATTLKIERNGITLVGDAALALAGDRANNELSGLGHLLRRLVADYQSHDQDYAGIVLDRFFDIRRGNRPLSDDLVEHNTFYEEAHVKVDLDINNIGKSHLLLKYCQLPAKRVDDIKLQVSGDLTRYEEIKAIMTRIAKTDSSDLRSSGHHTWHSYYGYNGDDNTTDGNAQ